MAWLEITIPTTEKTIDRAAALLTAAGFSDLVIEDGAQYTEFLEDNRDCWDYIDEELEARLQTLSCIKLYLEAQDTEALREVKALANTMGVVPAIVPMPDTDWEESWKDSYPPVPLGSKLIILPYWLPNPDPERIPVILDPGLTFGTGNHPTTQLVLEQMEKYITPGSSCIDLGSGSGILSIAALRLGAGSAIGVDIDPKAEGIARENAAYNGFDGSAFTAVTGSVTESKALMDSLKGVYDVVLVNIVADVIIALSPVLPEFMGRDTVLILSGILDSRLGDVLAALKKAGLKLTAQTQKEEWCCLTATWLPPGGSCHKSGTSEPLL